MALTPEAPASPFDAMDFAVSHRGSCFGQGLEHPAALSPGLLAGGDRQSNARPKIVGMQAWRV